MNTPRKNYDALESPYAKHLPQYPSQTEGYLPLELGGPGQSTPGKQRGHTPYKNNTRYSTTPTKYEHNRGGGGGGANYYQNKQHNRGGRGGNNRYYGGAGGGNGGGGGGGGADSGGRQWTYDNNYQRQGNRYNGGGNRGGGGGGQGRFQPRYQQNKNDNTTQYFHPSMLEDPWRELMERQAAIGRSQIDLQRPQEDEQMVELEQENELNKSDEETADVVAGKSTTNVDDDVVEKKTTTTTVLKNVEEQITE